MSEHVHSGEQSLQADDAQHIADAGEELPASPDAVESTSDESYEQILEVGWTKPLEIPVTGAPAVDDAMSVLAGLSEVDLHEHPEILQGVHDRLRAVLSDGASI
jgi:hypothetical protein